MTTINMTAGTLRAILCFIAPEGKPKIAYDNDQFAVALHQKVTIAVGEELGSTRVSLSFDMPKEKELYRQFKGVALEISKIFDGMIFEDDKELINNN